MDLFVNLKLEHCLYVLNYCYEGIVDVFWKHNSFLLLHKLRIKNSEEVSFHFLDE